eukprot:g8208.t1 g8208   contig29:10009-10529(-)
MIRSIAVAPSVRLMTQRQLSGTCTQSVYKLNDILENYRACHYSQEVPNRFRKEIVKAVSTKSSSQPSGIISAEGIQSMLANIGAGDQMTRTEIESILREVCGNDATKNVEESCVISAKQMLDLISTQRAA